MKRPEKLLGLVYFAIGFSPITALALTLFNFWSLALATLVMVLPAIILSFILFFKYPMLGRLSLIGWVMGLVAVFFYDLTRVPFLIAQVWQDFIPKIGELLLGTSEPNWAVGYLWRYVGNGGGMGLAFVVGYLLLKPNMDSRKAGIIYGIAIWLCLMLTLLFSSKGQQLLFQLNPLTVSVSLLGHVVYGTVLGGLLHSSQLQQRTVAL